MTDMIVFNTAWMAEYDGPSPSFNAPAFRGDAKRGHGHEILNFRNIDGHCYGYVPPPTGKKRSGELHFERYYDVPTGTKTLEGVTVVWTAPHPDEGSRAVVGVWKNATIYRSNQKPSGLLAEQRAIDAGEVASYRCKAKATDCILLPPEVRPILIPDDAEREGWPGTSSVFYPKSRSRISGRLKEKPAYRRLAEIVRSVDRSALSSKAAGSKSSRSSWQADVERRLQIEKAAIDTVGDSLERRGFTVRSVERDNCGYDLVATHGREILHVEVKGRSGSDISADLTPNEYACLKAHEPQLDAEANHLIVIVTDALVKPLIHEFALVRGKVSRWATLDGKWQLAFEERTAARLTAVPLSKSAE